MANNDENYRIDYEEKNPLNLKPKAGYKEYFRINLIHEMVAPIAEYQGINGLEINFDTEKLDKNKCF